MKQSEVARLLARHIFNQLLDEKFSEDNIYYLIVEWLIDNKVAFKKGNFKLD